MNPDDLIMVPRSLTSVKSQVREVQDKMDRHRQLMDRYLNQDTGLSVDDMRGNPTSNSMLALLCSFKCMFVLAALINILFSAVYITVLRYTFSIILFFQIMFCFDISN